MTLKATREDIDFVLDAVDRAATELNEMEFSQQAENSLDLVEIGKLRDIIKDMMMFKHDICKKNEHLGVWF